LREGKTTLPLIIAMQRCSPQERAILQRAIEEGNTEELEPIVNIVRNTGAMQATRAAASMEAQRAIAALSVLPDSPYRQALMALAEQLLDRRT
jgi:octaprenyl-diphosphate synthase